MPLWCVPAAFCTWDAYRPSESVSGYLGSTEGIYKLYETLSLPVHPPAYTGNLHPVTDAVVLTKVTFSPVPVKVQCVLSAEPCGTADMWLLSAVI